MNNLFTMLHLLGQLYAAQRAMETDRKSPEAKSFLFALMDVLEQVRIFFYVDIDICFILSVGF